MNARGLALLDALRPPAGYRTTAALGTTYSADLVTCMVALVALDGACRDEAKCSRLDAFRALERLGPVVRIAAQQGRIGWSQGVDPRVLALLDGVVRPVPFDPRVRSFHPKVWLVRQQGEAPEDVRYVLTVGSRNLTQHASWDLGLTLVGTLTPERGRRARPFDRLGKFASWVGQLIDDEEVEGRLPEVDRVQWYLPEGVSDARFDFLGGDGSPTARSLLFTLPRKGRVLLLSPFVSSKVVRDAAQHWATATEARLVSSVRELDAAVEQAGSADALFGTLLPHWVDVADVDASPEKAPEDWRGEELEERGLHAKAFLVDDGERAQLLLGSANLTQRAWEGRNAEAVVHLRAESATVEPLWEWADARARRYTPSVAKPLVEEGLAILEQGRDLLSAAQLSLADFDGGRASELTFDPPLAEGALQGLELRLARFTLPEHRVKWDAGERATLLPACSQDERTRFVVLELGHSGGEMLTWVQGVTLTPPLHADRDREVLLKLMGARGFIDLVGAMLTRAATGGDDDLTPPPVPPESASRRKGGNRKAVFHLEELLRRLVRDDQALGEVDRLVVRYRGLLERLQPEASEGVELERFLQLWTAVSEGMRLP